MENESKELLIIFYRNPKAGEVKTRLAATIGDEKALLIYIALSEHTREITKTLPVDKIVFYTSIIEDNDLWPGETFKKALQDGSDLGARMYNAFIEGFRRGYERICIIGTDCYDLTSLFITEAFSALQSSDFVIGPAADGGYYLLGMRKIAVELFTNKNWGTDTVLSDTLKDLNEMRAAYVLLPVLRDVDSEGDVPAELRSKI